MALTRARTSKHALLCMHNTFTYTARARTYNPYAIGQQPQQIHTPFYTGMSDSVRRRAKYGTQCVSSIWTITPHMHPGSEMHLPLYIQCGHAGPACKCMCAYACDRMRPQAPACDCSYANMLAIIHAHAPDMSICTLKQT